MTVPEPDAGGAFDAEWWFSLIHRLAKSHAARHDLPEHASDIAQQAFTVLWERREAEGREFRADEAERLVGSLAGAERHARDVERRHLSLVRLEGAAASRPPEPCPRLARLAPAYARPAAFERRLLVGAWGAARLPGVLLDRQHRIFDLVWIAGAPAGTVAGLLGISARALHERLCALRNRIEDHIVGGLRAAMPSSRWEAMHLFLDEERGRPPARAVAEAVFAGLGRVIHTDALSLGIE